MRTSVQGTAVAAAMLAVLATGCSLAGAGEGPATGGGGGEPAAVGEPVDIGTVLVEASYPVPGLAGGSADIAVHELRVREPLARLTFSITTHDPEGDGWTNPDLDNTYDGLAVSLIDTVNLNRHVVVADGNQTPLRTPPDTALEYGRPTTLSYTFAAPPEDVTDMDVYIGGFPPFTDVPVVR
ncbi:hypothetical protein [Allonocardiopsis opalescens]|uniref:DUF4352 domain-containing protein n=1 Tax=Allonocardiopsis opalescens TaxID=1144618 RepID=A0A2T0PZM4_9ACTN|nr:hypothetical protein [Allonocardiopsis opalescens]PRX96999.1 hypothetical protein CLV72_10634 [Allonocardiopsis opalescens]